MACFKLATDNLKEIRLGYPTHAAFNCELDLLKTWTFRRKVGLQASDLFRRQNATLPQYTVYAYPQTFRRRFPRGQACLQWRSECHLSHHQPNKLACSERRLDDGRRRNDRLRRARKWGSPRPGQPSTGRRYPS